MSYLMGSFCTRAFLEFTRRRAIPAAILFVDISSAYYAVVRELIIGSSLHSASIEDIASSLALTVDDLQALKGYVQEDPVLCGEDGGSILHQLTRELHSQTWFLMNQDDTLVETRRGTRPGSSIADVLYSLLFTKVLERRPSFGEESMPIEIPWHGVRDLRPFDRRRAPICHVSARDLIYADDLATCLMARTAAALPGVVQGAGGATMDVLAGHGLKTNLGPKKTAALLSPVGAGAREVRRKIFSQGNGRLAILRDNGPGAWLHAVSHYKHLGSVLSFDGAMVSEAKSKLQNARTCFREGKKEIFCSPRIALARRVVLFKTHVLTALLAGSGAWPWLCATGWRVLDAGLHTMKRQLLRIPHDQQQNWSKERISAHLGVLPLDGLWLSRDCVFLLNLCAQDRMQHLRSYSRRLARCRHSPQPASGCRWQRMRLEAPGHGTVAGHSGLLRRAEAWHLDRLRCVAAFQLFARHSFEPMPKPVTDLSEAQHACLICRVAFL